jgi:hypothetical protein
MSNGNSKSVGGWLSLAVGVSYLVSGIIFFLMPQAQQPGTASFGEFMASLAVNPAPFIAYYALFVLGAVCALGVIPAVLRFMQSEDNGWLVWVSQLGMVGFAVLALDFLRVIAFVPAEAATFVQQDEAGRFAISGDNFHLNLDPNGWLIFGAVGLWVLVVSIVARRRRTMPGSWSYIGMATAVVYWLIVVANVFNIGVLFAIASALGGLALAPTWYLWLGIRMRRAGRGSV